MELFATAAKGLEPLLGGELAALGARQVKVERAGVAFEGDLEVAYRACLWSRLASRILLPVARFSAADGAALYAGARQVAWLDHIGPDETLAVGATLTRATITDSRFAALKVKDAVVDVIRDLTGDRPAVRRKQPDVQVSLHVRGEDAVLSIDLSGDSLHRRGYRTETSGAPLRETLAAAILVRAGWPDVAGAGASVVDPMCGSGTLLIEAALMAGDVAPGLERGYFGLLGWRGHDRPRWDRLLEEARERRRAGVRGSPLVAGWDVDVRAVRAARRNAERAGVTIRVDRRDVADLVPPAGAVPGLVVTNPPYGERLGELRDLERLYGTLGVRLKAGFGGWTAAVLTGSDELGKSLGLRASKRYRFFNGSIPCRLLLLPIRAGETAVDPAGREALSNRLRKNMKGLRKWAQDEGITCFRVYDADIPEYAVAVDLYGSHVVVQEYAPPRSVPKSRAAARLEDVRVVLPEALCVSPRDLVIKVRQKQRGRSQYEKLAGAGRFVEVSEGGLRFLVNLTDYVDTGLFLDHRLTRARIRELARGKRFLNLFGYTGSATVYAAAGGALATTTVDLSKTYLEWARRNMRLNGFSGPEHRYVREDVLEGVEQATGSYGLIFLDPPTFSTSKRMEKTLDVQRDHVRLIRAVSRLLEPDGVLLFSSNFRRFTIDREALSDFDVRDVTRSTMPKDFERNRRIHVCFELRKT